MKAWETFKEYFMITVGVAIVAVSVYFLLVPSHVTVGSISGLSIIGLLYTSTVKDYPVLLLDDVLSELDGKRQEHLLSEISHIQTLITCTGLDEFVNSRFQMDKIFKIVEGTVESEELCVQSEQN